MTAGTLVCLAFAVGVGTTLLLYYREIIESIENFKSNFPRGGPPTGMHPSPADDSVLLRRKRNGG